jgi:outer membrane protein TolC
MNAGEVLMKPVFAQLTMFFLLLTGSLHAQQSATYELSLDQALQFAADSSHQIQIARGQLEQAKGRNLESWRAFLPDVTLSENFMRSTDPVAVFSMKLKQGVFTEADFDINTLNNPEAFENFTAAIQIKQPLINIDAFYGKSAASLGAQAQEAAYLRAGEAVDLAVTRAYYGLILARESLKAVEEALQSATLHRDDAKTAMDAGLINEADFLGAQVRLAELTENRISTQNMVDNADALKFMIGLDNDATIVPTDTLLTAAIEEPESFSTASRKDLIALSLKQKAAHRNLWINRGGWIPRLNAFGGWEWNGAKLFEQNATNWTVGLQLQWNIFSGLGHFGRSKQAAAEKQIVQVQYRQAKDKANMQVRQARRALEATKKRINVAETAVNQASESLRIVEARFRQGLEKTSDLLDKEVALTNSRLRLLKAKYDHILAAEELKFATGS